MAQINRLKEAEISNGNTINADDLSAEFNQLASESNAQDTRITTIESNYIQSGATPSFAGVIFPDHGELTISSGSVTATGMFHTIDTEGDAATDDLETIVGGSDGELLVLLPDNDSRTVVVKHNTGNIFLADEADVTLDTNKKTLFLIYSSALGKWVQVAKGETPSTFTDLTDTNFTSLASGDRLNYDGTEWVNEVTRYESAEQTISSGDAFTVSHGLSRKPDSVSVMLVCKVDDQGHTAGEEIEFLNGGPTNESMGITIKSNSTNIIARYGDAGSPFYVQHGSSGAGVALTNSSWRVVVKAGLF